MPTLRATVSRVSNVVRSRVPWFAHGGDPESSLPYVPNRPTVNPILPVHDMDEVIACYRSIGFSVDAYDAGSAWVRTGGWEFLHLAATRGLGADESTAAAYVHVDDVDAWHRAITTNAPDMSAEDIGTQPWGVREFSVTDPAGNIVRVGQQV